MPPQTRLGERVPILGLLAGDITVVEPLTVKELGVGGATIETRSPLVIDSLHELRLLLGGQSVVMKGRVVHSHISEVDSDAASSLSIVKSCTPSRESTPVQRTMRWGSTRLIVE